MSRPTEPRRDIRLDYVPREWQKRCHQQRKRFSVLALHRRAGKTELAMMELIQGALKCDDPKQDGRFAYVAPFLKQAKTNIWDRIKRRVEPLRVVGACDVYEQDLRISFKHNHASIWLFGADNADSLRGTHLHGVVIDEVAQIKPVVWSEVILPTLAEREGWAMFIGTPNGINLFSELFYKALGDPEWFAARLTVYDTQALNEAQIVTQQKNQSENTFAREYMCDFSAAAEDQLINMVDVENSAKLVYTSRDIEHAPRIIGVDPARFGDDRSVIMRRQGLVAFPPGVYRGIDNMDLAARVANAIDEWHPDAVFIDSGAGAGVIDRLRQIGHQVIEVPFGGKAVKSLEYINRRTEMWWLMREWIRDGGCIPNETTLKQELATPIYWFDGAGKKVLESKEDIKKRLNEAGSPDIADALALTFAAPVYPKRRDALPARTTRKAYDPYAGM